MVIALMAVNFQSYVDLVERCDEQSRQSDESTSISCDKSELNTLWSLPEQDLIELVKVRDVAILLLLRSMLAPRFECAIRGVGFSRSSTVGLTAIGKRE